MTLSKQLLGLIALLFLMIFGLNFIISVYNIKNYLQTDSEIHAQDTATSLGLSLSRYISDPKDPILETMAKAIFDRGNYREIKLLGADGNAFFALNQHNSTPSVPSWFRQLLPLTAATAESEINDGWSIGGVIQVSTSPDYAYFKLFQQARDALIFSLVAFAVSVALLFWVLRFILLPLKRINNQALAIAGGDFDIIEPLPWTTEVRNVAKSMNAMSRKIAVVVKNLNAKLEALGRKLHQDPVTGLEQKNSFETAVKKLYMENINAFVFLVKLDGLASISKELDSQAIEQLFQDCAAQIKQAVAKISVEEIRLYHFFGAEFAVLAKGLDIIKAEQMAKSLSLAMAQLGHQYHKPDIAHIGVTAYNAMSTPADTLAAAAEAFEQAKLIGANSYYIRVSEERAKTTADWKTLVFDVIESRSYQLNLVAPTLSFSHDGILMADAFMQISGPAGTSVPVGTFIAVAEKFEKIIELDKAVIENVLTLLENHPDGRSIAVNVSVRTIKSVEFRSWLAHRLAQASTLSARLVFGFSCYAVAKEQGLFKEFIGFVHGLGAKVMLKRFETITLSIEAAKNLKPDYLRIARGLGNGVSQDQAKQAFVENMKEAGELLDIGILAENIYSDEDFKFIKAIGIAGASR